MPKRKANGPDFVPSKEAVIQLAKEWLKRPLTPTEKKRMSVSYLADLYLEANPIKADERSKVPFDFNKRVELLSALAVSNCSTTENWSKLVRSINPKAATIVQLLPVQKCVDEFRDWLFAALKKQPFPKSISTPLFALWEMKHGFDLSIRGATGFKGGDEWPERFTWEPEIYLSNFSCAKNLWRGLEESGEEAWSVILGIVMIVLRDFFARNMKDFQITTGLKKFRTGVGYPEGDFYEIKIFTGNGPSKRLTMRRDVRDGCEGTFGT